MAVTTMVISGIFLNVDGTAAVGTVTLTPNPTGGVRFVNDVKICSVQSQVVTLDVNGALSVTMVRCVQGYTVVENIQGADPRTYTITDGATANLKDF